MSKYRITLEGKTYEMEVELVAEDSAQPSGAKKENGEFKSAPKDIKDIKDGFSASSMQKQTLNNAGVVAAPMPGTVIRIEKGEGSTVKAGELVLVLEAMKMENEILAPASGTIVSMHCAVGGTVAGGEVLFEVKQAGI